VTAFATLAVYDDPVAYQALVRPRAVAVRAADGSRTLTYAALDALIGWLGHGIVAAAGEARGARVATVARNSIEQVALAFACQRVGAIFVPLNWRLTGPEIAALVADAEPALVLYEPEFADLVEQGIVLADFAAAAAAGMPAEPAPMPPDAPCTLLYTSGTTGTPKGVIVTRAGAFHIALNMAFVGEIDAASVMLCDVPMFHVVGLFAVIRTILTVGGTLVLSDRFAPAATLARLSDATLGVTHYFGVPQIASAMRNDPAYAGADLTRLKAIFTGGAPLPRPLVETFMADGIVLLNGYGMSEAGTVLHMPLDAEITRRHAGAVGYPAPAMAVRIVDDVGRDAPRGAVGELWLQGPSVTPGYWRRPEETAAAFHDGWFRTGDLARLEDGVFHIVDRRKDMYVSGGENVFPAEVEAVLLAHPDILDAAVVGEPDERWGERGVAFLTLRAGAALTQEAVLAHCSGRLARYKHPAVVVLTDALPRSAAGKVRKDLLKAKRASARPPGDAS
jgi:fatty-acyl-CoA synthase